MKIHIKGGRLIDPRSGVDAKKDVYIAAGKIVGIGEPPNGFGANRVIDAAGLVVCPGLVDLSARLREPGFEYLATLESEMEAAIAGGVTSLACPPDTDPPLDEPGLVEMLKYRAKNLNQARVYPVGALTQGLKDVDVVTMLRLQSERMQGALLPSAQEFYKFYGLTDDKLAVAKPDAIVLHPGPMNRGVEIDSSVADGKQSVILPQVTFGIAIRMAVMSIMAGNK